MSDCEDMPALEDDDDRPHTSPPPTRTSRVNNSSPPEKMTCRNECSDDDEEEEEDWEEMEEVVIGKTLCLFCGDVLSSVQVAFAHMIDAHGFDFVAFVCKFNLDQIGYIKLVNYIRGERPRPDKLFGEDKIKWESNCYMKPVLDEDSLLMYDVEEVTCGQEQLNQSAETKYNEATYEELTEIISKQREVMQRMLQAVQANSKNDDVLVKTVGDMRPEDDEGYFNSYAHFDIHHEMLSRVLDLGCGTAILSMFSARAGAVVTGVDMSEVIYQALDIVKENRLDEAITLHKGRLEDLQFDHKFDFIVSEWMGYFLLFEGMLDSVLYARDKHLVEGGLLLPNRCTMHLVGMEDMSTYSKLVAFWDDVYGFKMSCMQKEVIKEATTDIIADFDLMKITSRDTEFTSRFSLTVERDGRLTGLVGYFDTYFDMPSAVFFSTGPHSTPTHWKQTVFYLPEPRAIKKGEILEGSISVRRKRREVRSLDVGIYFDNQTFKYLVE
ncbi:arginine N-methyltransferase 3-like [Homarus americanus]|uniref:type I protein arginine methyltransferase n=1 Tax=Homarus americanus TaxID=6706 RepID=A0A8J5N7Q5_HOMAM|nr:arginine N-methyltransferase 3-like [Homarus americanus]